MNTGALQLDLQRPYRRKTWQTLLPQIFPGVELFTQAAETPLTTEAQRALATGLRQIGRAVLRDENGSERIIAIFEADVVPSVDVVRNRVALRQLVSRCIDEVSAHAVLAFFVQPRASAYRLTYAAKESIHREDLSVETTETATKRYTYVLGAGEARRTAAQRLAGLAANRDTVKWKDVADAFSVEKLNDEFFKTYKEHYLAFCKHLLDSTATAAVFDLKLSGLKDKELDKALKPVRDFVKKLLGRLVFLHFIQKKQWLGCPADRTDWTQGDPEFIQTWFAKRPGRDRFYRDFLVPLFYDALNNNARERSLFAPTGTRVPYLNGGLFERELVPGSGHKPLEVERLDLPDAFFAGLLEFLSQYNFTIDENDPDDHEIGIDPEMLGHIFENLLEDNKDKGAYYTPKAIVQYMCQQSLIHYLQGHFRDDPAAPAEIERLIRLKEPVDPRDSRNWLTVHAHRLEELLDDVKICDPAIGSGAFPIGLLQEIYWTRLTLHPGIDRAKAKRDIIQKSIHGVDIDAGAVEIARLRCWLALIVEEEQPRPLPNLDFKIMQGDSLLESFEGIPLDQLMPSVRPLYERAVQQKELDLGSVVREKLQLELSEEDRQRFAKLLGDYFPCEDPAEKSRLHGEIDAFVLKHLDYNVDQFLRREETELSQILKDIEEKRQKAKKYKLSPRENRRIKTLEADVRAHRARKVKLHELADIPERPYFLWHLFFQDVFERGGFDILIANPPYVRMELFKDLKPALREHYKQVYAERADLYCYFYARAVSLLRERGILCFISSNKFFRGGYGEKLRSLLSTETELQSVVDFGDLPIFEATTYPCILLAAKGTPRQGHTVQTLKVEREPDIPHFMNLPTVPQEQDGFSWSLESPAVLRVLGNMKARGIPLRTCVGDAIYMGVKTGCKEAFIIDGKTRDGIVVASPQADKVIKPYLGGRNVRKWACDYPDLWMIYLHHGVDTDDLQAVLDHLKPFRRQLESRATEQAWYELQQPQEKFVPAYEASKIIFPDIAADLRFALDARGAFFSNTAYCIASSDLYLLAVLNASCTQFFYERLSAQFRGGYLRFWTQYVEQIPIPDADDATKDQLRELARRAAKTAGSELAAIEAEINRIVYRLFKLESDEIALIEGATASAKPALDHKTALFTRILPELSAAAPYFSHDAITKRLADLKIEMADHSLRMYLSEAMAKGIVHDAGRGWYSRLADRCVLDPKPVARLVRQLEKEFSLLDFTCWSTQQVNPWMHHILSKFLTFVNVDPDGLPAVAEYLRAEGYEVHENPKGNRTAEVRANGKTVVIRPLNTHAPKEGHFAPPEAVLVDLHFENRALGIMDSADFKGMAQQLAATNRLLWATLCHYADKRGVAPGELFAQTNVLTAEV